MDHAQRVVSITEARQRRTVATGPEPPLLTKKRIVQHFALRTERTIERWMKERGMPFRKQFEGGSVRFCVADCDAWFRAQRGSRVVPLNAARSAEAGGLAAVAGTEHVPSETDVAPEPWREKWEIEAAFGVSDKTVERDMAAGMPCGGFPGGTVRFKLSECVTWQRLHRGREVDLQHLQILVGLRADALEKEKKEANATLEQAAPKAPPTRGNASRASEPSDPSVIEAEGSGAAHGRLSPSVTPVVPHLAPAPALTPVDATPPGAGTGQPFTQANTRAAAIEPWVDAATIAAHLACSVPYVRALAKRTDARHIPHRRIGRRLLFRVSVVDSWLEGNPGAS